MEEVRNHPVLWGDLGKNDKYEVNGLTSYHYSDENYSPPDFSKYENFLTLFCKLKELNVSVDFSIQKRSVTCYLLGQDKQINEEIEAITLRIQDYWSNEFLMVQSLKEAAFLYAKKL